MFSRFSSNKKAVCLICSYIYKAVWFRIFSFPINCYATKYISKNLERLRKNRQPHNLQYLGPCHFFVQCYFYSISSISLKIINLCCLWMVIGGGNYWYVNHNYNEWNTQQPPISLGLLWFMFCCYCIFAGFCGGEGCWFAVLWEFCSVFFSLILSVFVVVLWFGFFWGEGSEFINRLGKFQKAV